MTRKSKKNKREGMTEEEYLQYMKEKREWAHYFDYDAYIASHPNIMDTFKVLPEKVCYNELQIYIEKYDENGVNDHPLWIFFQNGWNSKEFLPIDIAFYPDVLADKKVKALKSELSDIIWFVKRNFENLAKYYYGSLSYEELIEELGPKYLIEHKELPEGELSGEEVNLLLEQSAIEELRNARNWEYYDRDDDHSTFYDFEIDFCETINPIQSGLPVRLMVPCLSNYKSYDKPVWIYFENGLGSDEYIPMTVSDVPQILYKNKKIRLSLFELNQVRKFIQNNQHILHLTADSFLLQLDDIGSHLTVNEEKQTSSGIVYFDQKVIDDEICFVFLNHTAEANALFTKMMRMNDYDFDDWFILKSVYFKFDKNNHKPMLVSYLKFKKTASELGYNVKEVSYVW